MRAWARRSRTRMAITATTTTTASTIAATMPNCVIRWAAAWPPKYPASPNARPQVIPPSAFQKKNSRKLHVVDAGHPRGGDPDERDPTAEEHRLGTVLVEEAVADRHQHPPPVVKRPGCGEHVTPEVAAERVADVVADDR